MSSCTSSRSVAGLGSLLMMLLICEPMNDSGCVAKGRFSGGAAGGFAAVLGGVGWKRLFRRGGGVFFVDLGGVLPGLVAKVRKTPRPPGAEPDFRHTAAV